MDISSTNPLSPSPLLREGVAARQRELPQTASLEAAGQQAAEAATARDAQLEAATRQVGGKPENAAPQLNNRAIELQNSLQAQLFSTQTLRAQQQADRSSEQPAPPASTQQPSPAAANPDATTASLGSRAADDISTPPPDTSARQTAAPRTTPQAASRPEDSSRAELNASAQQQAVAQYQTSQSLLQSSSGNRFSFSA